MTVRLYVLALLEVPGRRWPRYFPGAVSIEPNPDPVVAAAPFGSWDMHDYGLEPVALVAYDASPAQHAALAAYASEPVQADVVNAVPLNLDNTIGAGNLVTTKDAMRAWNIPGNWLTALSTWRELVRGIIAIFSVGAKIHEQGGGRLFPVGVTLNTTMAALPVDYRALLESVTTAKGYDISSITDASTMEDFLEVLTAQAAPQTMLGVVI